MTLSPQIVALFDLTGKRALVTGASGAFGAASARALAGAGARVALAGAKQVELEALQSEIQERGGEATVVVGRPETEQEAERLVAAASGDAGLDILVVASGFSKVQPATALQPSDFDAVIDANVRQAWLVTRAAGSAMIARGAGGSIVLVSSVRARFASPAGTSAYGASKAAVDMLVRSFASEWGRKRIRVNAIAPTIFRSSLTRWLYEPNAEERRRTTLQRIPLGRLAEPDDFAGSVVFLAAPASSYITGEILNVDGGFSCN
jgi:NAD(P)-dependent dehydrogenase (short-subunit alcohol dehydrogenase family)